MKPNPKKMKPKPREKREKVVVIRKPEIVAAILAVAKQHNISEAGAAAMVATAGIKAMKAGGK